MTNLEATIAVLERHRDARNWTDEAVAADLMTQLGLDPKAVADHVSMVTEAEAVAAEAAAKAAADRARGLREAVRTDPNSHMLEGADAYSVRSGVPAAVSAMTERHEAAKAAQGQTEGAGQPIGIPSAPKLPL